MSDNVKPRYVIPGRRIGDSQIITEPSIDHLLNDALGVIATEITKFRTQVNKGRTLTLQEARVLQGYIKSLVELSKEKRDAFDNKDLANYSNEELASLIDKLVGTQNDKSKITG